MSGGTFMVPRAVWQHPAFKNEKFSEREAWLWMLSEASWKPRQKRVGDAIVALERGQLAMSLRFAAKGWGWTESRVRRYLERLKKQDMVATQTDAGVTVVTICNYDIYQLGSAPSDASATQERHTCDANDKKEEINKKEGKKHTRASSHGILVADGDISQAVRSYNFAADQAGWPKVQKLTPTRTRKIRARLQDVSGLDGWRAAIGKALESDFCLGRTANARNFFSFDWLIKPENFTKLMEGNYDNRDQPPQAGGHAAQRNGQIDSFASIAARHLSQRQI